LVGVVGVLMHSDCLSIVVVHPKVEVPTVQELQQW